MTYDLKARTAEVAGYIKEANKGSYIGMAHLKEALSTSDFPLVFQNLVNAGLLPKYAEAPQTWQAYSKRVVLSNLRPQQFYELGTTTDNLPDQQGGKARVSDTLPNVPELTEYPTIGWTAATQDIETEKNGARVAFSFETILNDDLNQLADLPGALVQLAKNTEDAKTTGVLVTASGINVANFNGINAPETAALTYDSLRDAIRKIRSRKVDGRPVTTGPLVLLVPPALEYVARDILSTTTWEETVTVNGVERTYTRNADFGSGVTLVVNEWLSTIDQTANADSTWFLVPAAGTNNGRPAIVTTFLRGHETPELRAHNLTGQYLGGGAVPYTEGSFTHDDVELRLRHFVSAGFVKPEATYASDGSQP